MKTSNEVDEFTLARKVAKYVVRRPYRKPTQVGEEKILRRTGEPLLRNSAKLPRNFGRRGALARGPQRIGPGDCLAKTQVSAKPKGEV